MEKGGTVLFFFFISFQPKIVYTSNRDTTFVLGLWLYMLISYMYLTKKRKIYGEEAVRQEDAFCLMQFCETILIKPGIDFWIVFVCSGGAGFMHCACHHRRRGDGE